jgi:hypothetical protein
MDRFVAAEARLLATTHQDGTQGRLEFRPTAAFGRTRGRTDAPRALFGPRTNLNVHRTNPAMGGPPVLAPVRFFFAGRPLPGSFKI